MSSGVIHRVYDLTVYYLLVGNKAEPRTFRCPHQGRSLGALIVSVNQNATRRSVRKQGHTPVFPGETETDGVRGITSFAREMISA